MPDFNLMWAFKNLYPICPGTCPSIIPSFWAYYNLQISFKRNGEKVISGLIWVYISVFRRALRGEDKVAFKVFRLG